MASISVNSPPPLPQKKKKQKKIAEEVEYLLLVKFHQIPINGCRGEVENVFANQRPGRPSLLMDWPEKYELGRRS